MVEDICSHVLILDAGQQRFFDTIGQLRTFFADAGDDASLEDVFFLAIDQLASVPQRSSADTAEMTVG